MQEPDIMTRMWFAGDRWWAWGSYERECAAFDAEHPLSREVWESLQRFQREDFERIALMQLIPLQFEDGLDRTDIVIRLRAPIIATPWPPGAWLP